MGENVINKQALVKLLPELFKQLHSTKNKGLNFEILSVKSNKAVYWECPIADDHVWKARVVDRVNGSRCPFCINYRLSKTNSLLALHPVLVVEWHPQKNENLSPKTVKGVGLRKYWWLCRKGHDWYDSINSRIRKNGTYRSCSICLKEPLSITHPDIAKEWHSTKNDGLMPKDVRAGSARYIWWQCSVGNDHVWRQKLVERTRGKTGCPFCYGKGVSKTNSLFSRYPYLVKEWHTTKNLPLTPQTVYGGGKKKYSWQCLVADDHVWEANIQKRAQGTGCPVCRGLKVVFSNSLQATHPKIAIEWHPTKNGKLKPTEIIAGTGRRVWWQCYVDTSHEWRASCKSRTAMSSGCPQCHSGWTIENIRVFIKSLFSHLNTFSPAELYSIFQQNRLLSIQGSGRLFIKDFLEGKFSRDILDQVIDDSKKFKEAVKACLEVGFGTEAEPTLLSEVEDCALGDLPTTKDILASLESSNKIYASADVEAIEFLINSAVAKIWQHFFYNEKEGYFQLSEYRGNDEYPMRVKKKFLDGYEGARNLIIPKGFNTRFLPEGKSISLMQRYVAFEVKQRRRFGNWSGTGAGKTLSAILASRVINAKLTVICCPNNVIDTWIRQIEGAYPDSRIFLSKDICRIKRSAMCQYLILNYEYFQQSTSEAKLKKMLEAHHIDFIVVDEIHYSKQRVENTSSKRKQVLSAFLSEASRKNKKLAVLGMSATPVINTLFEGRTLIELITGFVHDDLETKASVSNCVNLYKKFVVHGIRLLPRYSSVLKTVVKEIDCSRYLEEIRIHQKPIELEVILTKAKLPFILDQIQSGTIIYTHYRREIEIILYDAIVKRGWRVAFFNGDTKSGLNDFLEATVDVLIATECIATGVDGLQKVCNRLIINCLPWTHAGYKQLIGRIYRQGQLNKQVDVIVPLTFLKINGERWSWCESRWKRIQYKKDISDAAVDGVIPEGHLKSPAQAHKDSTKWLERIINGDIKEIERQKIALSLSGGSQSTVQRKLADITKMNQHINRINSQATHQRFLHNSQEWYDYHRAYGETRKTWEVIPYLEAIKWCKLRSNDLVIGDFGCGEAFLAQELENRVYSFDHVAINKDVIACDMSSVPLTNELLDVAVFSLSLMGTNFIDYLIEAKRCLKLDGHLWVAESTNRFQDIVIFENLLDAIGFDKRHVSSKGGFTFYQGLKSVRACNSTKLNQLKGCIF